MARRFWDMIATAMVSAQEEPTASLDDDTRLRAPEMPQLVLSSAKVTPNPLQRPNTPLANKLVSRTSPDTAQGRRCVSHSLRTARSPVKTPRTHPVGSIPVCKDPRGLIMSTKLFYIHAASPRASISLSHTSFPPPFPSKPQPLPLLPPSPNPLLSPTPTAYSTMCEKPSNTSTNAATSISPL